LHVLQVLDAAFWLGLTWAYFLFCIMWERKDPALEHTRHAQRLINWPNAEAHHVFEFVPSSPVDSEWTHDWLNLFPLGAPHARGRLAPKGVEHVMCMGWSAQRSRALKMFCCWHSSK
jgi:hypothetical protein